MYICICNGITDRDIKHCAQNRHSCSVQDLQTELGVAAGCGCCRDAAAEVLATCSEESDTLLLAAA